MLDSCSLCMQQARCQYASCRQSRFLDCFSMKVTLWGSIGARALCPGLLWIKPTWYRVPSQPKPHRSERHIGCSHAEQHLLPSWACKRPSDLWDLCFAVFSNPSNSRLPRLLLVVIEGLHAVCSYCQLHNLYECTSCTYPRRDTTTQYILKYIYIYI